MKWRAAKPLWIGGRRGSVNARAKVGVMGRGVGARRYVHGEVGELHSVCAETSCENGCALRAAEGVGKRGVGG